MPDEKPNNNGNTNTNGQQPRSSRPNPLSKLPKVTPPSAPDPKIVPLAIRGFYPRKKDAPYANDEK